MWYVPPGVKAKTLDDRITDDKFCVAFDVTDAPEGDVDSSRLLLQNECRRGECENHLISINAHTTMKYLISAVIGIALFAWLFSLCSPAGKDKTGHEVHAGYVSPHHLRSQ
jgi:hypothetical protein